MKEIVEAMEGGLNIVDCIDSEEHCGRSGQCITRHVWDKVSRAIRETLEKISLEELSRTVRDEDRPMYFI